MWAPVLLFIQAGTFPNNWNLDVSSYIRLVCLKGLKGEERGYKSGSLLIH